MKRFVLLICIWGVISFCFSKDFASLYYHYRDSHSQDIGDLVMYAIVRHQRPHCCDNMYAMLFAYFRVDIHEADASQSTSDYLYSLAETDSLFFVKIGERLNKLEPEDRVLIREKMLRSLIATNEVERYDEIMYWDNPDSVRAYTERFIKDFPQGIMLCPK